jgi:hypothetical protein
MIVVVWFTANAFVNTKSPCPFNVSGASHRWKEWDRSSLFPSIHVTPQSPSERSSKLLRNPQDLTETDLLVLADERERVSERSEARESDTITDEI